MPEEKPPSASPLLSSHTFTKSEIAQAQHEFIEHIKRNFGEIWTPKSDGKYKGKSWDCRSMITLDAGLWRLCREAVHTGSLRAFGKIEVREANTVLRMIIFYQPINEDLIV